MRLIFVELNEINFDIIKSYLQSGKILPGFTKLFQQGIITTHAEPEYANLEPWIQWPSVHTGKTFSEHKIFRLGDFVHSAEAQFFEQVEDAGFCVGAVSPMNATNRLKNPSYFIPDPWTKTSPDKSLFSRFITDALVQSVNDNSQSKLTFKTIVKLGIAFLALVKPIRYIPMIKYAAYALGKPWRKALFLDMLLYEIHKTLFERNKPNFSTLFLNAGAHIQHHYFFNSPFINSSVLKNPSWYIKDEEDPFLEALYVYSEILDDLLAIPDTEVIIATGLSQKPYKQLALYYRLKDHESFLKKLGIQYREISPRMTRDFLVTFDSADEALQAEKSLSEVKVNGELKLFGEIDNRGKDLFITLTYSSEITNTTKIKCESGVFFLQELVNFVAIKNGEHQSKGFAYFSKGIKEHAPTDGSHVSNLHKSVLQFFGIQLEN